MQVNIKIQEHTFSLEEIFVPYIIKPLFLIFIYYGMFNRVSGFLFLTGGMTAVLVSAALFSLACLHMFLFTKRNRISALAFLVGLFFLASAFTPLVSGFIYNERLTHIIRYVIELGVCFGMFFSVYYFVREGLLSPKFIVYSFVIMGGIVALQLILAIGGMVNYGRLGGDIGGLNYIGNTLAVSAITYIMILNANEYRTSKRIFVSFFFVLVFLALIMTGTRAGLIAFLAGLFLYQVFGIKSRKFTKYALIFGLIILVSLFIVSLQVDLSLLLRRYTYAELSRMAMIRFNLYYGSVSDLTFVEFLFGRADLASVNSSLVGIDRYINPHNVFLSLIRFNGIFPFILFFAIFVILYSNYLKIYFKHLQKDRYRIFETTMVILLSTSFINVMFSGGKFTRNFFLFFAIGYVVGYIELLRSVKSDEEYKKLIL